MNLSSIGGLVGFGGFGIYNATKFAVEGLSEALAKEVAPLGIQRHAGRARPLSHRFSRRLTGRHPERDRRLRRHRRARFASPAARVTAPRPAIRCVPPTRLSAAVTSDDPPLHLVLGAYAYQKPRAKARRPACRHRPVARPGGEDGLSAVGAGGLSPASVGEPAALRPM